MSIADVMSVGLVTPPTPRPAGRPTVDPYADEGERLFEVVRGVRVEKTMGLVENLIAARLYGPLSQFCLQTQAGWPVFETMFSVPGSGNDRKPDVAFVSYQRWPANQPVPRVNAWPVVPDLAVEVISPTDKAFDVLEKVQEYFGGGVRQVWQIYSNVEHVLIYSSPTQIRVLTRADELAGDPVIPGFRMPVADLFPAVVAAP